MDLLKRFWFEFDISEDDLRRYSSYSGLGLGCGVTAYSYEDALVVLRDRAIALQRSPSHNFTSSSLND